MQVGDKLVTLDNETVTVEKVSESSEFETVYNVRVADYHTYFVGTEEWAWSVWAHNDNICVDIIKGQGHGILGDYDTVTKKLYIGMVEVPESLRGKGESVKLYREAIEFVESSGHEITAITAHLRFTNRQVWEATRDLNKVPHTKALNPIGWTVHEMIDDLDLFVQSTRP